MATSNTAVAQNRIRARFQELKAGHRKALIPYVTPEFPVRGTTVPLVLALEKAGADLVEVGIPFSDPIADGPTIQHSSYVALRNGVTLQALLQIVRGIRAQSPIPIVLMGYVNPLLKYGLERLLSEAAASGVDGFIVPDLLPDESAEYRSLAARFGISTVFLTAPTSNDARIRAIDAASTDFTYCVSVTGVTGARQGKRDAPEFESFLTRVKANTTKPFVVGFGISNAADVGEVWRYADGAVVGSALIRAIADAKSPEEAAAGGASFFRSLRPATDGNYISHPTK